MASGVDSSTKKASAKQPSEIELVERAYWSIALVDNDDKLASVLGRMLAPVLLKASSQDEKVREKVKDIIEHVFEMLKSRDKVLLPMAALFTQCQDSSVKGLTVVYNVQLLALGYTRLTDKEKTEFLPDVIKSILGKSPYQQALLLRMMVLGLPELKYPKNVEARKTMLPLFDSSLVRSAILAFLLNYLQLPYGKIELPTAATSLERAQSVTDEERHVLPPPGLSFQAVHRTTGGILLEANVLEKRKRDILTFLTSEIFTAQEILLQLIVASGDPRQSVYELGEDKLKIFGPSFNWNSKVIITRLFAMIQGSASPSSQSRPQSSMSGGRGGQTSASDSQSDSQRAPVNLRLKLKIVPYLMKSPLSANIIPQSLQVAFECLFGTGTNMRMRHYGAQFIQHMCDHGKPFMLVKIAPVLLDKGLFKLVAEDQQDQKLRELAFVAIGKLARSIPDHFAANVEHVVTMFNHLKQESKDVGLAVLECLSYLCLAYKHPAGLIANTLEALALQNVECEHAGSRRAALQLATSVFPFSSVPARYVGILACGDEREELVEEAKKSLRLLSDPSLEEGQSEKDYPQFPQLVKYLNNRAQVRVQAGKAHSTSSGVLPWSPKVFAVALKFCQTCLYKMCGVTEYEIVALTHLHKVKKHLGQFSTTPEGVATLTLYVDLIKQALSPAGGGDLHSVALGCLVEVVAACPQHTSRGLDVQWIKGFLGSPRVETREQCARLLGQLCSSLPALEHASLVRELLEDTTKTKVLEHQHGATLALGYVCAGRLSSSPQEEPMDVGEQDDEHAGKKLKKDDSVLDVIVQLVLFVTLKEQKLLRLAACCALRQIVAVSPLPFPDGVSNEEEGKDKEESKSKSSSLPLEDPSAFTKLSVVNSIIQCLSNSKEIRLKEQCALALGMMTVGDDKFPFVKTVLKGLFQTADIKHLELHMTIGEAVSCAVGGKFSTASRDPWAFSAATPPSEEPLPSHTAENLKWVLQTLISKDYCVSPVLSHRQSSGLWLVSLLKFCGHLTLIKEYLKDFQMVFMNMLTDDDVTQETASRGLGLIYDLADKEHKKELVVLLSNTLLMGRRSDITLDPDTKLFPEGVMGKSPQGGKLTTYQELCSVASDMNKPDLVYKFLSLAHHHTMWNSKKGAAFGFQHIAEQARDELKPHLPTLVPKLYRYQYDPHSGIKQAMKSIWTSVVPDSRKAVDQYFKEIMTDLQQNLNHHLWRNRESSCLALGDLLSTCQLDDVLPYLPALWQFCLKVLDDIKESVRQAAELASRLLSKVTVKACDPRGPVSAQAGRLLGDIFPVLLEQGMASRVQDVRAISLMTLLKITKDAGPLLKPHIPLFVPVLLDAVSSLEPQVLNTYTLKLAGDEKIQEKLDSIRVSASKSTPMMEAVNLCLTHIDAPLLEELIPKLIDIIKTGVGMATKVNTAQFMVSLARQSPLDIAPHIGKILAALLTGLNDISAGTRNAYASAIGQLVKYAKGSSVEKLNDRLRTKLFSKTDASSWANIGSAYYSMVMHSNDALKSVMYQVVPVVFLAMHDRSSADEEDYSEAQKAWQNTWDELVTSTESAVKMYLAEIATFVCATLEETASWHLKAQAAAAIATLADKAGSALRPPQLTAVCGVLLGGLGGRVWEGKESLLKASRTVTVTCKEAFLQNKDDSLSVEKFVMVLLKECKKKHNSYRVTAIDAVGCILEEYALDRYEEVFSLASNCIAPPSSGDNGDDDTEGKGVGSKESAGRIDLLVKCYMLLGRAWPPNETAQTKFFSPVLDLIKQHLAGSPWKIQLAMLVALTTIFKKFKCDLADIAWGQVSSDVAAIVASCVSNVKYSTLRIKALETMDSYTQVLQERGVSVRTKEVLPVELEKTLEELKNPKEKELAHVILQRLSKL